MKNETEMKENENAKYGEKENKELTEEQAKQVIGGAESEVPAPTAPSLPTTSKGEKPAKSDTVHPNGQTGNDLLGAVMGTAVGGTFAEANAVDDRELTRK